METGWDRLKDLIDQRRGRALPAELQSWSIIAVTGSCVGFLFGGFIGARNAADAHIERTKLMIYDNEFQAHREMQSASIRGFVRMGSRWGWRVGIFASLFSAVNIVMAVYRDRNDFVNTTVAGAVAGGTFRLSWGLKACLGGMIIGTAVTLPCALIFQAFDQMLIPSTDQQKQREERRDARQQRRLQREQRSQQVDVLLQDMDTELSLEADLHANEAPGLTGYYEREQILTAKSSNSSADRPIHTDKTGFFSQWRDTALGKWKYFRERDSGKSKDE